MIAVHPLRPDAGLLRSLDEPLFPKRVEDLSRGDGKSNKRSIRRSLNYMYVCERKEMIRRQVKYAYLDGGESVVRL